MPPTEKRDTEIYRGKINHELPQGLLPRTGVHIPESIVYCSSCDVNNTFLGADPGRMDSSHMTFEEHTHHRNWGSAVM